MKSTTAILDNTTILQILLIPQILIIIQQVLQMTLNNTMILRTIQQIILWVLQIILLILVETDTSVNICSIYYFVHVPQILLC